MVKASHRKSTTEKRFSFLCPQNKSDALEQLIRRLYFRPSLLSLHPQGSDSPSMSSLAPKSKLDWIQRQNIATVMSATVWAAKTVIHYYVEMVTTSRGAPSSEGMKIFSIVQLLRDVFISSSKVIQLLGPMINLKGSLGQDKSTQVVPISAESPPKVRCSLHCFVGYCCVRLRLLTIERASSTSHLLSNSGREHRSATVALYVRKVPENGK